MTPDLPRERDLVSVFKIYCEKRPVHEQTRGNPFIWVIITLQKTLHDKSRSKANAMGVKKVNILMKTMAEKAGLDNSYVLKPSAR